MQTLLRVLDQPPAAVAVLAGGRPLTYSALARRVAAFADELRRRELEDGARVALVLPPSGDAVAALLGCWQAGAVAVPLDPGWTEGRIEACLRRSAAELLVARGPAGVALCERLGWRDRAVIVEAPATWAGLRLEGVLRRSARPALERGPSGEQPVLLSLPAEGPPDGRLVSAQAVDAAVAWWREELGVSARDRVAWTASLPRSFVLLDLLMGLTAGAAVLPAPFDEPLVPEALVRWLHQREITLWSARPEQIGAALRDGLCQPEPPGDLRAVLSLGEGLAGGDAADLVRTLPWCRSWTVSPGPAGQGSRGHELPDWFDPAAPPPNRSVLDLLSGSEPDPRVGLRDSA